MLSTVSSPIFAILSALVEDYAGLHYGLSDRDLFLDRVANRAGEMGFDSLLDYYYFLRYDPDAGRELEKLIDNLVINETFFFREFAPLKLIMSDFVLPLIRAGKRPRIWSAACATGEEPLTLAMLLSEAGVLSKVDLIASDISARALDRAQSGRFARRSLRDVPDPGLATRWIREEPSGELTLPRELVDAIDWRRINLCDPTNAPAMDGCDVILCRNALIYFDDAKLSDVLRHLADRLRPQGALFVGVSESLLRFGTFLTCEEKNQVFFYRKNL
jgi:chemotaxis protein methyltransferase CheR